MIEYQKKLHELKRKHTAEELSAALGISKATLYTRLRKGNFKKGELSLLKKMKL